MKNSLILSVLAVVSTLGEVGATVSTTWDYIPASHKITLKGLAHTHDGGIGMQPSWMFNCTFEGNDGKNLNFHFKNYQYKGEEDGMRTNPTPFSQFSFGLEHPGLTTKPTHGTCIIEDGAATPQWKVDFKENGLAEWDQVVQAGGGETSEKP